MILGFAHPALVVPDLENARKFYEQMFGFETIGEEGWDAPNPIYDEGIGLVGSASKGYMLKGHNCFLELFQYSAPEQNGPDPKRLGAHEPGIRHLAFYVDDCRAEYDRLKRLGGLPLGEPVGSDEDGFVVYARDPFGNIIELCEVPRQEEALTALPGVHSPGRYYSDN